MNRRLICVLGMAVLLIGCGGKDRAAVDDPSAKWFSEPSMVIEGIMHAYETRDDSLYAALLADDFRYIFEPEGADSADVLGWGKEEEVTATGNLFRTRDVEGLSYSLDAGQPQPASGADRGRWMVIPISGGRMEVIVRDKEPMRVRLNRQEIVVRPVGDDKPPKRWEIVEWHDYPAAGSE
jgi:hypothetical protein